MRATKILRLIIGMKQVRVTGVDTCEEGPVGAGIGIGARDFHG